MGWDTTHVPQQLLALVDVVVVIFVLVFRTPFSALGLLFLNSSKTWTGNGELTFRRAQAPTEESEEPDK